MQAQLLFSDFTAADDTFHCYLKIAPAFSEASYAFRWMKILQEKFLTGVLFRCKTMFLIETFDHKIDLRIET